MDAIHNNIVNEVRDEVQNLDSSDCSTLPSIRYPSERKRKEFDMSPYKGMVPDLVEKIPFDVDGLKFFIVDVPDEDHHSNKYNDGRYFLLNTSSRKGFKGVRRIGKCQGNYVCNNDNCPFFREDKKRNQHQFKTVRGKKFCFSCQLLAVRKPYPAWKMIEYSHQSRLLEIYHNGNHTCEVKPQH